MQCVTETPNTAAQRHMRMSFLRQSTVEAHSKLNKAGMSEEVVGAIEI